MPKINICDYRLAQELAADCDNMSVNGVKNLGWIMNYDDIDFTETKIVTTGGKNIVENIALVADKYAYRMYVPGSTPYTGTNTAFAQGTYRNTFTKTVSAVILDNGPAVAHNVIDQLANGKFVVILENKYKGDGNQNTYEIFGLEQGLKATNLTNDKYSEDTQGGWQIELQETLAPHSAVYLWTKSAEDEGEATAASTLAVINSLLEDED